MIQGGLKVFYNFKVLTHTRDVHCVDYVKGKRMLLYYRHVDVDAQNAHYVWLYYRWGKALLGSTTYFDNRDLLPIKHLLRLFGQSLQCCPPNYRHDVNIVRQSFIHDNIDSSARIINNRKDINVLNPCSIDERDDIINYLYDEDSPPISYHKPPYDLWLFKERLYFHHLNYKPFKEFRRITEDQYRTYAEAHSLNKKTFIKGVRGLWIFAVLTGFGNSRVVPMLCGVYVNIMTRHESSR
jgi:hypothetical protein